MFSDYYYLSSVNKKLVDHFNKLAKKIKNNKFIIDIGSNDGILLKPLKKLGVKAVGIDPSINIGKIANNKGLKTYVSFFNDNIVKKIIKLHDKPDVIVASSIITHLENPSKFAQNIKKLLKKNGLLIIEFEYLLNFIKKLEYERFYFDRPFYYSLKSISLLFKKVGMQIIDVEIIDIHGSSLRCYIKNNNSTNLKSTSRFKKILSEENNKLNYLVFKKFNYEILKESNKFVNQLKFYKSNNKKIIGYGAPARLATITNFAKIDNKLIDFVIDDNHLKQYRYSPGMHIKILPPKEIINSKVDIVIVFAYEYFQQIKKNFKNKVVFYKPIPFTVLKK